MAKRGRKSAVALSVVSTSEASAIESVARPDPPADLDIAARAVWLGVVNSLPADWFDGVMQPVLAQYCHHVVEAQRLNELIAQAVEDPALVIADYNRLLRMRERETRVMVSLATKLRITPQSTRKSTRSDRGNRVVRSLQRPWHDR